LRPYEDIPFVFTGLRPGEKLNEDLTYAHEAVLDTTHERLMLARPHDVATLATLGGIRLLLQQLPALPPDRARAAMMALVEDAAAAPASTPAHIAAEVAARF